MISLNIQTILVTGPSLSPSIKTWYKTQNRNTCSPVSNAWIIHLAVYQSPRIKVQLLILRVMTSVEAAGDVFLVDTNTRRRAVGSTGAAGLEDGGAFGRALVEVVAVGGIGPCLSDLAVRDPCGGG